jgi:hypothetical protein
MTRIVRLTESDLTRLVRRVIREQDDNTKFLEGHVSNVLKDGYKQVNKISLPDGEYKKQGSGYQVNLYDRDGKTFTGYVIVTTSGIRGAWNNQPENVTNGTIRDAYKIFFKDSGYKGPSEEKPVANYTTSNFQQLPQEIIDAPGPRTNPKNGKGSFKLKNGGLYTYDFSNVSDYSSYSDDAVEFFISEKSENNAFVVEDIKPNSIWVGFLNKLSKKATIIYVNSKNKVMVASDKSKIATPPPQQ